MYLEQEIEIGALGKLIELSDIEIEFEHPFGIYGDSLPPDPYGQKLFAGIAFKSRL